MKYNQLTCFLIFFSAILSCNTKNSYNTSEIEANNMILGEEEAEVKLMALHYTDFSKEIICNGKLIAVQKANLKFRTSENLVIVRVKNGERVSKGQVLARLDDYALSNSLKQAQDQFEKAKIELQDILIGLGFKANDTTSIPNETLKSARIKSGYDQAINELELAKYNLHAATLRSPFDGVVANLFSKENNQSNVSDIFCTIIDDSKFEAKFDILENELVYIKKGQSVRIIPFAYLNLTVSGVITQINPIVDKNGMISVNAVCVNHDKKLAEGMNVKIIVEDKIPQQLVIPKKAIVLRNDKQVVFTYKSGLAKWNYVRTGFENTTSVAIIEGLNEIDTVIIEGNLNLAHDSRVKIIP